MEEHFTMEEFSQIPEHRWTGPGKYSAAGDIPAEMSRPVWRNGIVGIQTSDG